MIRTAVIKGIPTVCLVTITVTSVVCEGSLSTIIWFLVIAWIAGSITAEASIDLCADTDDVAYLDVLLDLGAHTNSYANDFVADDAGKLCYSLEVC